ncbi:MAG: hypothetical protein QM500_00990 [Methylococcales bacterium]
MIRFFNAYMLFPLLEKAAKRDIFSKYKALKKFEKLTASEKLRIQKDELYKILIFCQNSIPYYQDLFSQLSFDAEKIKKDIEYIKDIPILTKEIIRENGDRLKTPEAIHTRKTGGSTGQSVFFYYDDKGLDWSSAINLQAYDMAENFMYRKDCHISSELGFGIPPFKARFLDWLKLFSQNRKRLMISSFSDEDLAETLKNLRSIRPYLMQGHPSSAYAIANYIKNNHLKKKKYCHVFEPSGEMLTEKMVATIEEYLGAKVVNRYGNAEFGVMAHSKPEDPYTRLKIFDRAFYVEETQSSSLIITNFTNYGMPLLRYDTGDIGTVTHEPDGSYIYDIQGRIHDNVSINGEDYATHYIMDYLDHKIGNIREFQIIVNNSHTPKLNVVPENEEDHERILTMLKERWPVGLDIDFIKYEELEKVGWRQKFRHVIEHGVVAE